MRFSAISIFFILALSFSNCDTQKNAVQPTRTTISGELVEGAGKELYVNKISSRQKGVIIDTIRIDENGKFSHTIGEALPLDFYVITSSKGQQFYLLTDSTESISIKGSFNAINKLEEIKGSKHTDIYTEFISLVRAHNQELSDLNAEITSAPDIDAKKVIGKKKREVSKEFRTAAKAFIETHKESPGIAGLFDGMDFSKEPELASQAINHLAKVIPYSNYYKARETYVKSISTNTQNADSGKVAPNIELEDPDGVEKTLYELRGKVVLIDFWASWCGPCRRENPNVVKAYNKYHDEGFEVFSVSLDNDKGKWVKAIEDDGLIWDYHVSDLKKWATPYKSIYGFSGIPHTVLVDKEGKIVQSKIRGSQLEARLEEIFGF